MIDKDRFMEMAEMQDILNRRTAGDNWHEQGLNWKAAIMVECAEAIESLGYKWWKDKDIDLQNAKVELIDILHFVISKDLEKYSYEDVARSMMKAFYININTDTAKPSLIDRFLSLSYHSYEDNMQPTYNELLAIWKELGEDMESLYKGYMTKNILNEFRQDSGYQEGTYRKLWGYKGEEVEDNVVAFDIANTLEVNELFARTLKKGLEHHYKLQTS